MTAETRWTVVARNYEDNGLHRVEILVQRQGAFGPVSHLPTTFAELNTAIYAAQDWCNLANISPDDLNKYVGARLIDAETETEEEMLDDELLGVTRPRP